MSIAMEPANEPTFAAAHDVPIAYMQRTREYYAALGYGEPYRWAHFAEVPFHRWPSRWRRAAWRSSPPRRRTGPKRRPGARRAVQRGRQVLQRLLRRQRGDPDLRISHVAIDRAHTTAEDIGAYFPLAALRRCAAAGRIGALAARFHGLPTNRSHRVTIDVDCRELVARCQADGVDAVILVPNCPVCHQSVSLAARALEAAASPPW